MANLDVEDEYNKVSNLLGLICVIAIIIGFGMLLLVFYISVNQVNKAESICISKGLALINPTQEDDFKMSLDYVTCINKTIEPYEKVKYYKIDNEYHRIKE